VTTRRTPHWVERRLPNLCREQAEAELVNYSESKSELPPAATEASQHASKKQHRWIRVPSPQLPTSPTRCSELGHCDSTTRSNKKSIERHCAQCQIRRVGSNPTGVAKHRPTQCAGALPSGGFFASPSIMDMDNMRGGLYAHCTAILGPHDHGDENAC